MTQKVYRTAQGKLVDLGALQLQNENVRAVGNMKVNARGDLIDGWNKPIQSRNRQLARQYDKQVKTNVSDTPVTKQTPEPEPPKKKNNTKKTETEKQQTKSGETPETKPQKATNTPDKSAGTAPGGLAAAIARAREAKSKSTNTQE